LWQKSIAKKNWFNLRHTLITILLSVYLVWLTNYVDASEEVTNALLGCLIVCFAMIVGRHISNLLIFRYFNRHPEAISGQVTMSHPLVLAISTYHYMTVLLPVALIALCSGSAFAYGGVAGIGLSLFSHTIWRLRAKK